jgi:transcriptional regulator with AAA-type ATPase domain
VGFFPASTRFSTQGPQIIDHWWNARLERIEVANTPANLLRINKIFSFQSSALRNIIDFRENHFSIQVLTEPFLANSDRVLPALDPALAVRIFRQYLAFLQAAREWEMDFIDFSKFEIMPGALLRFSWELQEQAFPNADEFIPLFRNNRFLRLLGKGDCQDAGDAPEQTADSAPAPFLYRSDNLASNLLQSASLLGIKADACLKIRISTREPSQAAIIQNTLFHNLDSREILLARISARQRSIADFFAAGRQRRRPTDAPGLVQEFALYLKQSVFQKVIIIIDGLAGTANEQFLGHLIESGIIPGLTVILINSSLRLECDLELNEDPVNPLQEHFSGRTSAAIPCQPTAAENELLKQFQLIEAPVPGVIADALFGIHSRRLLKSLIQKGYLVQKNQYLCLSSGLPGKVPQKDSCTQLTKNQKLFVHFLEILIRGNLLDVAERLLRDHADANNPLVRLQAAHVAMRKKEYAKLTRLLAALGPLPGEHNDLALYLNFIALEKASDTSRADALAAKIKDPYFKNLTVIQYSDRSIYRGDLPRARRLLEGALAYFQSQHCAREEIEILNQMAKLHRETGRFTAAESLYKSTFVKSEIAGLRLNSAFTAVDLGNLYLESNDNFRAESWYQKALRLFVREKNSDGIMLVNSNRINILIDEGKWKEAEHLLRDVLARNEEKALAASCAIDCLNWAQLEYLRLNSGPALDLLERAAAQFAKIGNNKGLAECALLRAQISFLESHAPDERSPGVASFNSDQKHLWDLCRSGDPCADAKHEAALMERVAAIQSEKVRFNALAMLLRKSRKREWLAPLKEVSRGLSEKSRNYFFYEYECLHFELAADPGLQDGPEQDRFLAMYDFFTMNKRSLSEKLRNLRGQLQEKEDRGHLYDDARLVENYRQWRLPEDFFSSFRHALDQNRTVDWLALHVFRDERPLFRFASSSLYQELAAEMMLLLLRQKETKNWDLAEVQSRCTSQEKLFYPFASTKMTCWPITENLRAGLIVAFKDKESYFWDFFARNKAIIEKFSLLFKNFFENDYNIREKLDFIIGSSQKVMDMKIEIAQVSKVDFSLLITGESGCGKELVAQAVHRLSPRANQPFISVNAAALPETLLEAELFGFKKGAFSGALETRIGLLEAADRGTFFLDEVADLPLSLQAKMLRVLQEKEIRRLGENRTMPIDIRLISASNRNLEEMIASGRFREDLFYRLQDLTIKIPPLRERREDIPLLTAHFLEKYGKQPPAVQKAQRIADLFQNESFPGNVRELESKIKKLVTYDPGLELSPVPESEAFSLKSARHHFDRSVLVRALEESRGNKSQAAKKLGISRMALFNLLKKHQINK